MRIRKAILTGGGRATRLQPITTTTNKHLLPLANKPMIFYAIEKVIDAGIEEIFINTNPGEKELQAQVGDGERWGVPIKYFEQTGGPQGIAHAVNEARDFIWDEPFMFYLSDNILIGGVSEMVEEFSGGAYDCMLAFSEVKDPNRFGVPVFDENKKLIDVLEKPESPPNNFAVTGIYLYGPKIFFDAFQNIQKSARGEYEISSIHSHLLKTNRRVGYKEITGWWKDTGKPDDLLLANKLLLNQKKESELSFIEEVRIGSGARVSENVNFIGPVIIGSDCVLENCTIGPSVSIGDRCEIKGGCVVKESILLDDVIVRGNMRISDSIIGKYVHIIKSGLEPDARERKMILGNKTEILEV